MVIKNDSPKVFYDTSYVSNNTTYTGRIGMGVSKRTVAYLESILHPFSVTEHIDRELVQFRGMLIRDKYLSGKNVSRSARKYNRVVSQSLDLVDELFSQKTVVPNPCGEVYNYFRGRHLDGVSDADCSMVTAAVHSAMERDTVVFTRDYDFVRLTRCIDSRNSPLRSVPLHLAVVADLEKTVLLGYGRYRGAQI